MRARSRTNYVPQPPSWSLECVHRRLPACVVIPATAALSDSLFTAEALSDALHVTRARACSLQMSPLPPWASGCVIRAALVSENREPRPLSQGTCASTAPRCLLADWLFPLLPGQLASVGVENTEDNRRGLRELLVGTEQCETHLSGVVRVCPSL
jgi:hypothetical protein